MNKIVIDYTKNIDKNILERVSEISPWDWLKEQLTLDYVTDEWVSFVKNNISSILLDEQGEVISYWAFWSDNKFSKNIIKNCWLDVNETFLWVYLFTNKKYRWKWYAELLKDEQIKYIKENFSDIKYLLWETEKKKTLKLYKKYWAVKIKSEKKFFFKKIFSYYYKIRD